jgi:hypothetical protein
MKRMLIYSKRGGKRSNTVNVVNVVSGDEGVKDEYECQRTSHQARPEAEFMDVQFR